MNRTRSGLVAEAVTLLETAVEKLDAAEEYLLDEERLHEAPWISNQNQIGLYATLTVELERIIREHLHPRPYIVIPS